MNIYAATISHCLPEILAFGLSKAKRTMGNYQDIENWVVVDHHWPMQKELTSHIIRDIAEIVSGDIIKPDKNYGGCGGANIAFKHLNLQDDDLVIGYDPDSNPITMNWGKSLVDVMIADPSIPYLSLMHAHVLKNRNWKIREVAGHRVASDDHAEMFNVTIWRGSVIKNGFPMDGKMWGGLESMLWSNGIKGEYLIDVLEDCMSIGHPKEYTDWKIKHNSGEFPQNFDEYVKLNPPF